MNNLTSYLRKVNNLRKKRMQKGLIWITTDFTFWRGFNILSLLNKTSHRVHSLGASFDSGVDLDVYTSSYGVTHVLRFPSSSKCGVGSILLSVFVLVDPGPSLGGVWEL